MKFVYVDESGAEDQGDVFVMCGLMVDAYSLRKKTEKFEELLNPILGIPQTTVKEFKTKKFIEGKGVWKNIKPSDRMEFLKKVCALAKSRGLNTVGLALSFSLIKKTPHPSQLHHWPVSAMFLASLVQKKMQLKPKNKGLTVFIMDDNQRYMPSFSEELYTKNDWFDGLYEVRKTGSRPGWKPRNHKDRFDQIINTAFSIKSDHATLIQVADVICYIYRRHLELTSLPETWRGEKVFYRELFQLLETKRHKLGNCPSDRPCVKFYKAIKHTEWNL